MRNIEVEKREDDIKAGITISFPWLNEAGTVQVVHLALKDAADDYLKARKSDQLRQTTLNIYREALAHLQSVLKPTFPIENITLIHIDKFKESCTPGYSPTTINIRLRAIRTFLIWMKDRNLITEVPPIRMLNNGNTSPKYLSNLQFNALCKQAGPYLQSVFHFYRETGCRLSEPFQGEINGSFLTIEAESAKGKRSRDIFLTPELLEILVKARERTHPFESVTRIVNGEVQQVRSTYQIKYYSKAFLKACRKAGIHDRHFHHLRHTAAVRTYLKTRDIYEVARLLGHANVTTTEIYARFDIKRLEQDFPDLVSKPTIIPFKYDLALSN